MFSVLLVSFLAVLILYYLYKEYAIKVPPGPTRYPFIGSFHLLLTCPKSLIELVQYDRYKYGDITYFKLLNIDLVFLNSTKLIKQMVGMEQCAGRSLFMGKFKSPDGKRRGLLDPDSSPFWKDQKRFVLKSLRDYGFGKKSEQNIQEESKTLVNFISSKIESKEDFFVKDIFNIPVVNVIWRMVANKTFQMDGSEGQMFVKTLDEILSKRDMKTAIPIIGQYMPVFRRRKELMRQMKDSMMNIINEHEKTLDETAPRDLIDNYLIEMKKGREGFNKDELVIIIFDLFAAGSETTSTTLRWAIIFLILNLDVQRRCHEELDEISDFTPSLSDMNRLNYCQATILETLRYGCIAPGTLMHKAMDEVEVGGYKFPKETQFCGNFMGTHFDPEYWEEPEKFMPERFLDSEGKILTETPNFFPFSLGKRVCLGESLAKVELFLFFTAILKNFHFKPPLHHPPPCVEDFQIFITKIPSGFYCSISERH